VFDAQRLAEPVLESALRTHSHLATPAGRRPNPAFTDPAEYLRSLPVPEEPLEATTPLLDVSDVTSFRALRQAVANSLAGMPARREETEDFLLAVDEMTTNALRHGRPPVDLRLWADDKRLVCTVTDRGAGLQDPFIGYGPAHGNDLSLGGMGLWLARQLCDHVDISVADDGVHVRLTTVLG
jgi:anti-sigma regulatory factor (Ser/Thr protein kinase)